MEGEVVFCSFTTIKPENGEYLFERFVKGEDKDRVAIGLYFDNLKEDTNDAYDNDYLHFLMPVVYGDRASIDFIKEFITALMNATTNQNYQKYAAQTFLNICRYTLKPICYKDEHEIRSLVIWKNDELQEEYNEKHTEDVFNKRCIFFQSYCDEGSHY